jgi:hypothetical protein
MSTSTAEGQRVMDLHGQRVVILGDIDHLVFTEPFATGSILTVDGGTVLA